VDDSRLSARAGSFLPSLKTDPAQQPFAATFAIAILSLHYETAKNSGTKLPSNHSPLFAPDVDPALRTGISAEVAVLRDLLRSQ
jgi:hypothetical protein